jgi:hypothetical protein
MMHFTSIQQMTHFMDTYHSYKGLREMYPKLRASQVYGYLRDDEARSIEEYICRTERGHDFIYTGSNYGGFDDSYSGEGRCYCANCGADGDG